MTFKIFADQVRANFDKMADSGNLFITTANQNDVWLKYLESFPEGTNETFRERGEFDCQCCKNFIRNIGNVVSIKNGKMTTIWRNINVPHPFDVVTSNLDDYISDFPVENIFATKESKFGQAESNVVLDGKSHTWNHFEVSVPNQYISQDKGFLRSTAESSHQVASRGLRELNPQSIQDIIDLIEQDNLYKGEENLPLVQGFQKLQREYSKFNSNESRALFVWENIDTFGAKFRNTAIGSLAVDLSRGVELEEAVRMFESKVAPQNYKRSKSLITPKMIDGAVDKLKSLNLEDAINRRFARIEDVSVNNVLWVDNSVQDKMKDSITSLLNEEVKPKDVYTKNATEVSIAHFMDEVLPNAKSIKALVRNNHLSNLMSLTAPVDSDTGNLFKWNNDFAWSYDGEYTDSISAKVKKAGGRVEGAAMRVSLSWYNYDDLDIHVQPPKGKLINFGNKDNKLDVDMNVSPKTRDAVENVSWMSKPDDGDYVVYVNNYRKRESVDVGFTLEVESSGLLNQYSYFKPVIGQVKSLVLSVSNGIIKNIEVCSGVTGGNTPKNYWGIKTESFVDVDTVMFSPNYWDDNKTGNKHWFFMLRDCINPNEVRGFYNEFLSSSLEPHRKVFEVLGAKTKCPVTENQLSGIGFSSTKRNSIVMQVDNRAYKVNF